MVVEDSFDAFKQMYQPIALDKFKDVFEIKDGKFIIDSEDKATQKMLYMAINDNIHKNLEGFSVRLFDQDQRLHKEQFSVTEKELIVDKLMEKNDLKKQEAMIWNATDRILFAHRNLKLMLFLTSGQFFILLTLIKYTIKFSVLYLLY